MKILIISHYFPPLNSVASLRPYSWAKYWSKMGHDVTVLTTKKMVVYSDLTLDCKSFRVIEYDTLYSKFCGLRKESKLVDSSKNDVVSLKNVVLKIINKAHNIFGRFGIITWDARMPSMLNSGKKRAFDLVNEKWDLVVSTFAPFSTHLIAYRLKRKKLANVWIADYRDLWTETHMYRGLFPFSIFEEHLEKRINRNADYITTVSEPLFKQIKKKYLLDNVYVIENGFDSDDLKGIPKHRYWNDNLVRIIYTGNIYKFYRDPSPLFEAIRNIKNSGNSQILNEFEVLFAGNAKGNLDELIDKFGVGAYVKHLGQLKRDEVLHMQRDADILLFLEFESEETRGILTGKLFEYLASGTDIWVVGLDENSSVGQIVVKSKQGLCFGKNTDLIESKIIELIQRKVRNKGKASREILDCYSRESLAKRMLELIK